MTAETAAVEPAEEETAAPVAVGPAADDAPAPEPVAPAEEEVTSLRSLPKVGVAECDEWVVKMVACLENPQFPEAAREPTRKAFRQVVEQWVAMPEAAKQNIAESCRAVIEASKKSYEPFGCVF